MKDRFLEIFNGHVAREGSKELVEWLKTSTFFSDPASAKSHLNCQGGLCVHSVHVYERLKWLCEKECAYNQKFKMPSDESIAIVSLLHDLCKIGCYKSETRNQKTYDHDKVSAAPSYMVKRDAAGCFIWETVNSYKFEDDFPMGHGEKSVYLANKFIRLTDEEAMAIRYHMGSWQDGEKNNASKAFSMYPLAFLLHLADEYATFIDEMM